MHADRAERVREPRVERQGVVGDHRMQGGAQGGAIALPRKRFAGGGEANVRAGDLRTGRIVDVEVADEVQPGCEGSDPHLVFVVLRHPRLAAIGDQEVEGVVGGRRQCRHYRSRRRRRSRRQSRERQTAARAPGRHRRRSGAAIENASNDAAGGDRQPCAPGAEIPSADDARRSLEELRTGRRPLEELVAIGGDDERQPRERTDVDRERAH